MSSDAAPDLPERRQGRTLMRPGRVIPRGQTRFSSVRTTRKAVSGGPAVTRGEPNKVCGFAGELRFDGRTADVAALREDERLPGAARPRRLGDLGARPGRDGAPAAVDHRPQRGRLAADGRSRARLQRGVQRLHLQLPAAARRAGGRRLHLLLHLRHRGDREGVRAVGRRLRRATSSGCSPSPCTSTAPDGWSWPGTGWGSSRSTWTRPGTGSGSPRRLPALLAGGGTDTSIDTDRARLLHELPLGGAGAADHPERHPQAPAGHRTDGRARRDAAHDWLYWEPEFSRDPAQADWTEQDWEEALLASLRTAVDRRMVADVPVGVLLSGGIDSSLVVALLAEAGQHGLQTFSIGFESAGGESGDEFEYSVAGGRAVRDRPPQDPDPQLPAAARASTPPSGR